MSLHRAEEGPIRLEEGTAGHSGLQRSVEWEGLLVAVTLDGGRGVTSQLAAQTAKMLILFCTLSLAVVT